jgi:L-ascorbate metabolism protein UlaG (beta-lactamase superfamily)
MTLPLSITRVTHSCVPIQFGEMFVLTDPWFSEKFGYHPGEPVAMTPRELAKLSAVLVSHNHYDHCDFPSFADYAGHDVPVLAARTVQSLPRRPVSGASSPWQSGKGQRLAPSFSRPFGPGTLSTRWAS